MLLFASSLPMPNGLSLEALMACVLCCPCITNRVCFDCAIVDEGRDLKLDALGALGGLVAAVAPSLSLHCSFLAFLSSRASVKDAASLVSTLDSLTAMATFSFHSLDRSSVAMRRCVDARSPTRLFLQRQNGNF